MALDEATIRRMERWKRELEELTPEDWLGTAAMLRDAKPRFPRQSTRDFAEKLAREFEARAVTASRRGSG